jgi:Tol biopolymer transport system component
MKRTIALRLVQLALLLPGSVVLLTACDLRVAEITPTPIAANPNEVTPVAPASVQAPGLTSTPAGAGAAAATPRPVRQPPTAIPTASIPRAWADLTGQLVFVQGVDRLVRLDLATGTLTTLLKTPDRSWLRSAAVSPDGTLVLIAYEPPAPQGGNLSGFTQLYIMPTDGSQAPALLFDASEDEEFYDPMWSPDAQSIYYMHFKFIETDQGKRPQFGLERRAYPHGQPEMIIEDPLWARLSPDGTKLAYVLAPANGFSNDLYLADAVGANPRLLLPPDSFAAVDAPFISPDGSTIVFSASDIGAAAQRSWLDWLLGVQVASAHNLPSDWWRVSVSGGQPERLTQLNDVNLYGAFSPDGEHIAFTSLTGLYIMNADGTQLLQILRDAVGSVSWTR